MNWQRSWHCIQRPLLISLLFIVPALIAGLCGYRLNTTGSLPLGLYRLVDGPPGYGDTVLFCLPLSFIPVAQERGYLGSGQCPGGLQPLGKNIYALPGDQIEIKQGIIAVNGQAIVGSQVKTHDRHGRPVPASILQPGIVPAGQTLPLSLHNPGSFDGRYFGLVPLAGMRVVQPVLVVSNNK